MAVEVAQCNIYSNNVMKKKNLTVIKISKYCFHMMFVSVLMCQIGSVKSVQFNTRSTLPKLYVFYLFIIVVTLSSSDLIYCKLVTWKYPAYWFDSLGSFHLFAHRLVQNWFASTMF